MGRVRYHTRLLPPGHQLGDDGADRVGVGPGVQSEEIADHAHDRTHGVAFTLRRASGQYEAGSVALVPAAHRLLGKPRLPDPRLARQHDTETSPLGTRGIELRVEEGDFAITTNHRRRDDRVLMFQGSG